MAAEVLSAAGRPVEVYDRMPSLGRKFLMAGRGGLNLTHSEAPDAFLARYGPAARQLAPVLRRFSPEALRAWAASLGEETFVGTSGRVFPRAFKASPLLRAWLGRLAARGVSFRVRHTLVGMSPDGTFRFAVPDGEVVLRPAATVLALGGASWPRLGASGDWAPLLGAAGVAVSPLRPANMALRIAWSEPFRARFAGTPLKRIGLAAGGRAVRGEAVITAAGLEGGAVYALSGVVRDMLDQDGSAVLRIDLRPDLDGEVLARRLAAASRGGRSRSTALRRCGLPPVATALLREGGPLPADPDGLARRVKALALAVAGTAGLERAISTAGGVAFAALDDRLMLRAVPGVFVAGEMIDWEAPTGGYLLQASFATGVAAAEGVLAWLGEP
jgi:uncharacterized flavoprotein (TIGR03862 family)